MFHRARLGFGMALDWRNLTLAADMSHLAIDMRHNIDPIIS
jgi:hypothetical protein